MIKKLPKHKTYLADRKLALVEARDRVVSVEGLTRAHIPTEPIAIGLECGALYRSEKRRSDAIQDCAKLWSAAIGLDKAKHWTHAVPQALYDALESFDTACSVAAAIGFLEAKGYVVTKKPEPNVGPTGYDSTPKDG